MKLCFRVEHVERFERVLDCAWMADLELSKSRGQECQPKNLFDRGELVNLKGS